MSANEYGYPLPETNSDALNEPYNALLASIGVALTETNEYNIELAQQKIKDFLHKLDKLAEEYN